jgi:methylmalonyl-CoA mutase C-terminal domain/subunit
MGMEVHLFSLFLSKSRREQLIKMLNVVAKSLLNGLHLRLFPKVRSPLNNQGAKNIVVLGGGIISEEDKNFLQKQWSSWKLWTGTSLNEIIEYIGKKCNR